jgi:hypothetical protein
MQVADLQQYVRSLGTTLAGAGAKGVAADLERAAAGLEPFRAWGIAQLADFLVQAETYARTGVIPTSKSRGRVTQPKADSATIVRDAVARVQALYERATDPALTYGAIEAELKPLGKLSKDEAIATAQEVGIVKALKTKKNALEEIGRKISERKESFERIQFRPGETVNPLAST